MYLSHFYEKVFEAMHLSRNLLCCLLSFKHDETVSYKAIALVYVSNGGLVNPKGWERAHQKAFNSIPLANVYSSF